MLNKKQKGFTLLELMIGLVLGLLIIAAGLAVFIGGQRSLVLQGGMGELQQNANFGLAMLTHDLRHTNLNTPSTQRVNNKQVGSGIIFIAGNLPSKLSAVNSALFTKQENDSDATDGASDQLTIQYLPAYTKTITGKKCPPNNSKCTNNQQVDVATYSFNGMDCEGNRLEFFDQYDPPVIVQRYHVKADTNQIAGQPTAYSLYCDAGSYNANSNMIDGMASVASNGQQLMQRIDTFRVIFEVKGSDKKLRYMTIKEYEKLMSSVTTESDYYNVVAVEIGLLARSTSPLNSEKLIDNKKEFTILGNKVVLNKEQKEGSKFLREVFSQVVSFRNTLGAA